MAILEGGSLQEADRRQIVSLECSKEVVGVISVVGRLLGRGAGDEAVADRRDRARPHMHRIGGRRIVLEPGVMRDVVE